MNLPDPSDTFLFEAEDLLKQVEDTLLEIEQRPDDTDAVHQLFRAFHTLKGSGAMFGFTAVSSLAHHVETVLDRLRAGAIAISPELVAVVLATRDQLKALLEGGKSPSAESQARSSELIGRLQAFLPAVAAESPGAAAPKPAPSAARREPADEPPTLYRILFQPAPDIAATGCDPASLLNELRQLGSCRVEARADAVPPLADLDAERCHFSWTVELTTRHELNHVRDVFVFVEDTSVVRIEALPPPVASAAVAAPGPKPSEAPPGRSDETVRGPRAASGAAMVRVPAAKLDHLVNLVGELVINQSRLLQVAAKIDAADLLGPVEALERLVADLRDSVLGIRMMPIGSTFSRFKRLVHDLSLELGKKVELVTEGAETEVDKTVLDQLGDPLVHLIRNSIDHGICLPDARRAAGKPEIGTVRLTASHEGSHVVVEIADDGRGIDVAAVRRKAVEKGLIAAEAELSEKEIFDLIFLPGFSTAKAVTSVSGRGVGMDVAKRQIESLRGTIQISSRPGAGTTIRLSLPLTLAIIDGLLVEIDTEQFILPLSAVTENVEIDTGSDGLLCGQSAVAVRGELVPYLCLRDLFGLAGRRPPKEKVVLVNHGGERVGLSVDRVLGKHQTVIQSLGRFYRDIQVTSGATIMGDGRVALILDVAGLLQAAARRRSRSPDAPLSLSAAARGKNLPSS